MRREQAFQGLANALCMGLGKDAVVVLDDKNVTRGALVPSITPQEADGRVGEDDECRCGGGIFLQQKVLLVFKVEREHSWECVGG